MRRARTEPDRPPIAAPPVLQEFAVRVEPPPDSPVAGPTPDPQQPTDRQPTAAAPPAVPTTRAERWLAFSGATGFGVRTLSGGARSHTREVELAVEKLRKLGAPVEPAPDRHQADEPTVGTA